MNDHHLYYLHNSIRDLMRHGINDKTIPTLFEYYCALQLSYRYDKAFTVWKDISPLSKAIYRVPNNDMGVDCASSDFKQLLQVKHYGVNKYIGYGTLSTFLSFRLMFDKSQRDGLQFLLARTDHSRLCQYIQRFVGNEDLYDYTFSSSRFLEDCQRISGQFIEEEEPSVEIHELRPPQVEALVVIEQSNQVKKNCILSIPTGVGKTVIALEYIRSQVAQMNNNHRVLVFVPTLVLLDQWYQEAIVYGLNKKRIVRIGSDVSSDERERILQDSSLVICVNNSVQFVMEHISSFHKIFVDEAHRIHLPRIYTDEDITVEETDPEESESEDDEPEVVASNTYLTTLKKLIHSQSNVVLLSATIDRISNYLYYSFPIREAINEGYLCDYQLVCPIFSDCPDDSDIANYLITKQGECHCIVFCNSIHQADAFVRLLNSLLPGCARSIHSNLSRTERDTYIQEFRDSKIRFLVNVRVLVEGFNCPIISSCVFLHLPSNDIFAIQALGRCLRLYPGKQHANIYLPYNKEEDGIAISRFITEIGKKDSMIRQACTERTIGTYINLQQVHQENESDDAHEMVEFRYNVIFDSFGSMVNGQGIEKWMGRLEQIKEYIRLNKKLPSKHSNNSITKSMRMWIDNQQKHIKSRMQIMNNDIVYNTWIEFITCEEFKEYFVSNDEEWYKNLDLLENYIKMNNRLPSREDIDENIRKLGKWINTQQTNYSKRCQIMNNTLIFNKWESFLNDYKKYFVSNEDVWYEHKAKLEEYINEFHKSPSKVSKNAEVKKLGQWFGDQKQYYKNKSGIMKNEVFYVLFDKFIEKYKTYLPSDKEVHDNNLDNLREYFTVHKKRPQVRDEDESVVKLARWMNARVAKYKSYSNTSDENYQKWIEFTSEFDEYFLSNEEKWDNNLERIQEYMDKYERRPSEQDADPEIRKLGQWVSDQQQHYRKRQHIMKNLVYFLKWYDLITNSRYNIYF